MKLAMLFEKPSAKTVWVILFTRDKLILGKRSPAVNNPNQWNFFGGHIDDGETPEDAAIRELEEEANLPAHKADLKKLAEINGATYFSLRVAGASAASSSDEVSKVKAFKLTDLPNNLHAKTQNFFDQLENLLS